MNRQATNTGDRSKLHYSTDDPVRQGLGAARQQLVRLRVSIARCLVEQLHAERCRTVVIATTSWPAAFAKAAGAIDVVLLAAHELQHGLDQHSRSRRNTVLAQCLLKVII